MVVCSYTQYKTCFLEYERQIIIREIPVDIRKFPQCMKNIRFWDMAVVDVMKHWKTPACDTQRGKTAV